MQGSGTRRLGWWVGLLAAGIIMTAASDLPAPVVKSLGVKIAFTGIRGSKQGEDYVDADLAEMGPKIKKQFGLKRVEIIAQEELSVNTRWVETVSFGDDMKLKLSVHPVRDNIAWFTVTITRGGDTLIRKEMKIKMNDVGFAVGKIEKDAFILMMVPNLDPSADE